MQLHHPGFYLPNDDCPFTWSGLHLDSSENIFASKFDSSFDWGKAKYVTSISDVTLFIIKWMTVNSDKSGGYALGSYRAYNRWELRELSGFDDVPDEVKTQYPVNLEQTYKRNMDDTEREFHMLTPVPDACVSARKWVNDMEPQYKRLRSVNK